MSTTQPSGAGWGEWAPKLAALVPPAAMGLAYMADVVGLELATTIGLSGSLLVGWNAARRSPPVGEHTLTCQQTTTTPASTGESREVRDKALKDATEASQKLLTTLNVILGKGQAAATRQQKVEMLASISSRGQDMDVLAQRTRDIIAEYGYNDDWGDVDEYLRWPPGTTGGTIAKVKTTVKTYNDQVPPLEKLFEKLTDRAFRTTPAKKNDMKGWATKYLDEQQTETLETRARLTRFEASILGPAYKWDDELNDNDLVGALHKSLSEIKAAVKAVKEQRQKEKEEAIAAKRGQRAAEKETRSTAPPPRPFPLQESVKPVPIVMMLNGAPADRAALITFGREHLDDASDSSLQKCVTALENGDVGKFCGDVNGDDHGGIRHVSRGKKGAAGTCTLFYHRDETAGQVTITVMAVGQHAPAHVAKVGYNVLHTLEPNNLGRGNLILEK